MRHLILKQEGDKIMNFYKNTESIKDSFKCLHQEFVRKFKEEMASEEIQSLSELNGIVALATLKKDFGDRLMKCIGPTINPTVQKKLVESGSSWRSHYGSPSVGRSFGSIVSTNSQYFDNHQLFDSVTKDHIDLIVNPEKKAIAQDFFSFRDRIVEYVNNIGGTEIESEIVTDTIMFTQVHNSYSNQGWRRSGVVKVGEDGGFVSINIPIEKTTVHIKRVGVSLSKDFDKMSIYFADNAKKDPQIYGFLWFDEGLKYSGQEAIEHNITIVNDPCSNEWSAGRHIINIADVVKQSNIKEVLAQIDVKLTEFDKEWKEINQKYFVRMFSKGAF